MNSLSQQLVQFFGYIPEPELIAAFVAFTQPKRNELANLLSDGYNDINDFNDANEAEVTNDY